MVVIVFRSRLRDEARADYGRVAGRMEALAARAPGFVSIKGFAAEDGERVSIVEFESADHAAAWKRHPEHLEAQREGRDRFYEEYRVQVCTPIREYRFDRPDASGAAVEQTAGTEA